MNCPVCNHGGLAEHMPECPECGSKLNAFLSLGQIRRWRKRMKAFTGVLGVALVASVAVMIQALSSRSGNEPVMHATVVAGNAGVQSETSVMELQRLADEREKEIANLKHELDLMRETNDRTEGPASMEGEKRHIVQRGESFWSIARNYYQDGFRFSELARHNNLETTDVINPGDTLIIP